MNKFAIKGSTLKMIAAVTMIIDHIGASVLQLLMTQRGILGIAALGIESILTLEGVNRNLAITWWIMRMIIGRIAFPIYCYLLVEGFLHTRNVLKYVMRLLVFAIVSEIPFNLALFQKISEPRYQNVFFTLLLGLIGMWGIAYIEKIVHNKKDNQKFSEQLCFGLMLIGTLVVLIVTLGTAELLKTDYGAAGVFFVLCLYFFRKQKTLQMAVGCVGSLFILEELTAPLAFLFVAFYQGERGLKLKYFFYCLYPLHLILLYGVCILMGIV